MISLYYMIACAYVLFTASITTATPVPIAQAGSSATTNSAVPIGTIINRCTTPGTIALTFDDGPYQYTSELLDLLSRNGVRGTFFVNGQNFGNIYDYAGVVQRMHNEGHQVASHTWSHPYLTSLDYNGIVSQMTQLEDALKQIIGVAPRYMRAPYFAVNDLVLDVMTDLGYHVIDASIDTKDYANDDPSLIGNSINNFKDGLNAGGNIVLAHDVHEQTVRALTPAMLDEIKSRGLTAVTVGECLGDAKDLWYK